LRFAGLPALLRADGFLRYQHDFRRCHVWARLPRSREDSHDREFVRVSEAISMNTIVVNRNGLLLHHYPLAFTILRTGDDSNSAVVFIAMDAASAGLVELKIWGRMIL
jgi:hypothetical protein